jgi:hypothetical protein
MTATNQTFGLSTLSGSARRSICILVVPPTALNVIPLAMPAYASRSSWVVPGAFPVVIFWMTLRTVSLAALSAE